MHADRFAPAVFAGRRWPITLRDHHARHRHRSQEPLWQPHAPRPSANLCRGTSRPTRHRDPLGRADDQAQKANHDKANRAARKKAFEAEYGDWIAAQNGSFRDARHSWRRPALRGERPMAQYDVFTNPSGSAAEGIPYVRGGPERSAGCLGTARPTMPLAVLDVATKVPTALCPVIMVKGQRLHALAHYAAPCPRRPCGDRWRTWLREPARLVSALDAVLSGI
ncbi:MAG: CcdB family protein [Comamonadaceae bacterium]|nr:CcdB family protein [Comamonadaceae bacterium]